MTRFAIIVLSAALLCSACGGGALERGPATASGPPIYRLAADDKLRVAVFGEPELTGQFNVGSDGNLSFPLIGMVPVRGLTLAQLQATLTQRLSARYINKPRVSVDVVEYRPFYILGEVTRSGQYPYRVGITVEAAIATAGGFSYRASKRAVAITHAGEAGEHRYRLTPSLLVSPGDTVRVLERYL